MPFRDTMHKFNNLIRKASDAVICDSACQHARKSEELKQIYINSQANLASAPTQVYNAQKNYITFADGQPTYNKIHKEELQQQAENMSDTFSTKFKEEANITNIQIDSYDVLLLNFKNVFELFRKYKKENVELLLELKNETNDVLTNERKTFYEDQQIDGLKYFYYNILIGIYIICVICFAAFSLLYPSQNSFKTRLFILIALIALPFVSSWILGHIIYLIYSIYELLPKNVYKQTTT